MKIAVGIALCLAATLPPAKPMPAAFERLKTLVGAWDGTTRTNGEVKKVVVTYEPTAGGTVLVEKYNPGSPAEMVSTFYAENGEVRMTHYCLLGNHPRMRLRSANGDSFSFAVDGKDGIGSKKERHMRAVTLKLAGPDALTAEWITYKGGKPVETHLFNFTRRRPVWRHRSKSLKPSRIS